MKSGGVTYYQQYRKCGKAGCRKCAEGAGHGPYWYARGARGRVTYIGKVLPSHVLEAEEKQRDAGMLLSQLRGDLKALHRRVSVLERYVTGEGLSEREEGLVEMMLSREGA